MAFDCPLFGQMLAKMRSKCLYKIIINFYSRRNSTSFALHLVVAGFSYVQNSTTKKGEIDLFICFCVSITLTHENLLCVRYNVANTYSTVDCVMVANECIYTLFFLFLHYYFIITQRNG